jgi:hypothetical protein
VDAVVQPERGRAAKVDRHRQRAHLPREAACTPACPLSEHLTACTGPAVCGQHHTSYVALLLVFEKFSQCITTLAQTCK